MNCRMWSVKWGGVGSAECSVWSVECGECGVRSVECGV